MLRILLLVSAGLIAVSAPAVAKPFTLVCHVTPAAPATPYDRTITIDPDAHTVQDELMLFKNGTPSVLDGLEQFVLRNDEGLMRWGLRRKSTGDSRLDITLDLRKGTYLMQTDVSPAPSRGVCRQAAAAIS